MRMDRSSHQRCSVRKVVLRNFTKFTEKHLCQSLFFNNVAALRPALCLGRCKGGTVKSLEVKIASFCELFLNGFYFKDVRRELISWSVRKF